MVSPLSYPQLQSSALTFLGPDPPRAASTEDTHFLYIPDSFPLPPPLPRPPKKKIPASPSCSSIGSSPCFFEVSSSPVFIYLLSISMSPILRHEFTVYGDLRRITVGKPSSSSSLSLSAPSLSFNSCKNYGAFLFLFKVSDFFNVSHTEYCPPTIHTHSHPHPKVLILFEVCWNTMANCSSPKQIYDNKQTLGHRLLSSLLRR